MAPSYDVHTIEDLHVSAIEHKPDHAKISCVPKIYLKKTNLVIMVTTQILMF